MPSPYRERSWPEARLFQGSSCRGFPGNPVTGANGAYSVTVAVGFSGTVTTRSHRLRLRSCLADLREPLRRPGRSELHGHAPYLHHFRNGDCRVDRYRRRDNGRPARESRHGRLRQLRGPYDLRLHRHRHPDARPIHLRSSLEHLHERHRRHLRPELCREPHHVSTAPVPDRLLQRDGRGRLDEPGPAGRTGISTRTASPCPARRALGSG